MSPPNLSTVAAKAFVAARHFVLFDRSGGGRWRIAQSSPRAAAAGGSA